MAASCAKVSGQFALDRQHVVGAVRLDHGARGVAGGVQGVEGEHAAAQVDVLEQRAQRRRLAALVAAAAAGQRSATVGDQRDGLEVHAVRRVAVRAAVCAATGRSHAIGRQRRQVRILGEPRRRPDPQRLLQGIRVGAGHHPADGRRRRRRPAAPGAAPRAQRAQFPPAQVGTELRRRHRPREPRQPRQRADRQHRLQAVLAALPAAAVRQPREHVAQRPQLGRRVAHRHRPARPLRPVRRIREPPARVPPQRPHEHLLPRPVRVRVRPVVAGEALGAPHPHPVRRVVARAPEPRRVHERLRELQRMAVQRRPVRTQPTQAARQRPRRQVADPRRRRQHQEARVVRDQVLNAGTAPTHASPASGPAART